MRATLRASERIFKPNYHKIEMLFIENVRTKSGLIKNEFHSKHL